jgi:GNAT superfamily N-acetyltransferase
MAEGSTATADSREPAPKRAGRWRLRPAYPADAMSVSALVRESFLHRAARDWTASAVDVFLNESSAPVLADRIGASAYAAIACSDRTMAGFLLLPVPSTLGMLFVAPTYQLMGVGRALWERALWYVATQHPEVGTIELNATPYATAFYRRLGFEETDGEFVVAGCRATRMAFRLRAA